MVTSVKVEANRTRTRERSVFSTRDHERSITRVLDFRRAVFAYFNRERGVGLAGATLTRVHGTHAIQRDACVRHLAAESRSLLEAGVITRLFETSQSSSFKFDFRERQSRRRRSLSSFSSCIRHPRRVSVVRSLFPASLKHEHYISKKRTLRTLLFSSSPFLFFAHELYNARVSLHLRLQNETTTTANFAKRLRA